MSKIVNLSVDQSEAGVRLDVFLAKNLTSALQNAAIVGTETYSRAFCQKLIKTGCVKIAGQVVQDNALRLPVGVSLEINLPRAVPPKLQPVSLPLEILYEDPHMLVLNKAAGIVVHPGAGTTAKPTLVEGILAHCRDLSGIGGVLRPGIVHRLDRDTSGVLVVAKHDQAHQALQEQFAQRLVQKTYLAVVMGTPAPRRGTIDTLYARHPVFRQRFTTKVKAGARSRRALTHYRVLYSALDLSVVELQLATGRTHQLRVHMYESGHGILGDPLYKPQKVRGAFVDDPLLAPLILELRGQALHAFSLKLVHPLTGEPLCFKAPLPLYWRKIVDLLKDRALNPR